MLNRGERLKDFLKAISISSRGKGLVVSLLTPIMQKPHHQKEVGFKFALVSGCAFYLPCFTVTCTRFLPVQGFFQLGYRD